ncbi:hypothetical protein D3C72_1504320 [compost metagenome]
MQGQGRVVAADIHRVHLGQQRKVDDGGGGVVDVDAVGPVLGPDRGAGRATAQAFDQLHASGAIQARKPQGRRRDGLGRQRGLRLEQHAAIEALRRGRRVLGHPVAVMFAIHRAGGNEHDPFKPGDIQRRQHVGQAVDEDPAIRLGVAPAGRGQMDQPRHALRQGVQGVGSGDVGLQPPDAAGVPGRRMAAQGMNLVAARQEAPRHALAEVPAADEKYAFAHGVTLLVVGKKGAPRGASWAGGWRPGDYMPL